MGDLGSELLDQVAVWLVGCVEGLGALGKLVESVLELVFKTGSILEGLGIDLGWGEVSWDLAL
jgi:hypothetical protein